MAQEIFNKVIEAGSYNEKDGLMCLSLKAAARQEVITAEGQKSLLTQLQQSGKI